MVILVERSANADSSYTSTGSDSAYLRSEYVDAPLQETPNGPGFYRRMPCKARGVTGGHVANTAFIDIPVNATHGTLLHCSHSCCRNSGRLFRFCTTCQVPVAKRNFSRRHSHVLALAVTSPVSIVSQSINVEGHPTVLPTTIPIVLAMLDTVVTALPESLRLNDPDAIDIPVVLLSMLQSEEANSTAHLFETHSGLLAATKDSSTTNTTLIRTKTDLVARCESLTCNKRTIEEVTEEELHWLHLFRQKPKPDEAKVVWLLRLEEMAGIPHVEDDSIASLHQKLTLPMSSEIDDDEMSEIETSEIDLANLEASYMERSFDERVARL